MIIKRPIGKLEVAAIAIFLTVMTFCVVRWCGKPEPPIYVDGKPKIDTIYNRDSIKVYQQQIVAINAANARSLRLMADSLFRLNEKYNGAVARLQTIEQKVQVIDIDVPFVKDTAIRQPEDTAILRVPVLFEYKDSALTMSGKVYKNGLKIDKIELPNSLAIRDITLKYGFLHLKKRTVVQAMNSNPYFYNGQMQTLSVEHTQSKWSKWIKPVLVFGAGVIIGKKLL